MMLELDMKNMGICYVKKVKKKKKKSEFQWPSLVTHACNTNYSGSRYWGGLWFKVCQSWTKA
jgi:hypothetical protein